MCQGKAWVAGHLLECGRKDGEARHWATEDVVAFVRTGVEIGSGGAGRVYANEEIDPSVVIKMSSVRMSCKQFERDFSIAKKMEERIKHNQFHNPLACVVEVFAEIPEVEVEAGFIHCALIQQRVFRPKGLPFPESVQSYQAYLGEEDYLHTDSRRGIYLGANQIEPAIEPATLMELAAAMGDLIGFLHYGALCDAGDMEYLLGTLDDRADARVGIIAVDFDRVQFFTREQMSSNEVVRAFHWSIRQETYFPDTDSPLYPAFEKAYLHQGARFGYLPLARKVLEE